MNREPDTATVDPCSQIILENAKIKHQRDMLLEALNLVMPMAKGYACAHKVGSNAEYIRHAEDTIATVEGEK